MKRIVFCFDGTWNRLDSPCPTNVVVTAQSITPVARGGVTQIIHYDEGVGTSAGEQLRGGLFGQGLVTNIADAYRFLIFNYAIGDEIYIFGFSRGAFTARSFAGLIRNCGIPRRRDAARITEAVRLYTQRAKDDDHASETFQRFRYACSPDTCVDAADDEWRVKNRPPYVAGQAPIMRIRYLGVWDTVGSLGVPNSLLIAPLFNRKYAFHDTDLSPLVVSARHAVAIDEKRKSFAPTIWTNFEALNRDLGFAPYSDDAPYQQKWFPGTHGSVGGGGDIRDLSDEALDWIISGARDMGLELDASEGSPIFALKPNHRAPLDNVRPGRKFSLTSLAMSKLPTKERDPGPQHFADVSPGARDRWAEAAVNLPDGALYRPKTLDAVAKDLDAWARDPAHVPLAAPAPPDGVDLELPAAGGFYTVKRGDTLGAIAKRAYGKAARFPEIFEANRGMLRAADRIYVGQVLRIP